MFILDRYNSYVLEFFGFLFFILNIIIKEDGIMCFRDISYIVEIIFNFFNILCCLNGRYIIYYNNRINFLFFVDYCINVLCEFCELEVYGI